VRSAARGPWTPGALFAAERSELTSNAVDDGAKKMLGVPRIHKPSAMNPGNMILFQ